MKRFILVLSALMVVASLSAQQRELVILHTNDTHSHIDPVRGGRDDGRAGVIERAVLVDSVRNSVGKRDFLLLDAGDFSQGSSYFTILGGFLEVDVMNAMGYDVACLGNHEFDNGPDELAARLAKAKFKVVCANYDFDGKLGKIVKPYTIVRKAGRKIGIIGLLTDVTDVVDKQYADKMTYKHPAEVVNNLASFLKEKKKCDLVICLTHLGYSAEIYCDPELVEQTRNVDLVIGGHSHTFLKTAKLFKNLDGEEVPVVQDGCWGINVGEIRVR